MRVAAVSRYVSRAPQDWRVRPRNPPPHAVRLAIITASVVGAATGVLLAFASPGPESAGRSPAGGLGSTVSLARPREEAVRPVPSPRGPGIAAGIVVGIAAEPPVVQPASPASVATVVPALGPPLAARPPAPMQGPARSLSTARAVPPKVPAGKTEPARAVAGLGDDSLMVPAAFQPASPPPVSRAATGQASADDRLDAEELIWLAERAFQSGHPVEAVRLGKKALAAHGGARAHLALAAAYFDLRRFDDARASYRAVLQAEPGNEAARIGLDLAEAAQARPQP